MKVCSSRRFQVLHNAVGNEQQVEKGQILSPYQRGYVAKKCSYFSIFCSFVLRSAFVLMSNSSIVGTLILSMYKTVLSSLESSTEVSRSGFLEMFRNDRFWTSVNDLIRHVQILDRSVVVFILFTLCLIALFPSYQVAK